MGRKCDIPPSKVAQMCALRHVGLTERQIATQLCLSHSSIHKCLVRTKATGSFTAKQRPARQRVTSSQTDRAMRRIIVANPTASSTFIAAQLPQSDRPSISTIQRRLRNDFLLKAY